MTTRRTFDRRVCFAVGSPPGPTARSVPANLDDDAKANPCDVVVSVLSLRLHRSNVPVSVLSVPAEELKP